MERKDIDVVEVHDCFTIAEILAMEDLGFYKKGSDSFAIEVSEQIDEKRERSTQIRETLSRDKQYIDYAVSPSSIAFAALPFL